tara:strand:+ start:1517 stop:2089 length:573 start_codon:yes stop_codon:yes gene_type:complete
MAGNRPDGLHRYSVQEATNAVIPKLIKIQPAVTAADNADNDVIFNWTELENVSRGKGQGVILQSVALLDRNDAGPTSVSFDLYFCRGSISGGTSSAPSAAQRLGAADAVVDITGAEAKAIEVCGHINMTSTEGDLLTGSVVTSSNIGLVLQPHPDSTSIYVAGVYRFNPADTSTGSDATDGLDFYFGFVG